MRRMPAARAQAPFELWKEKGDRIHY